MLSCKFLCIRISVNRDVHCIISTQLSSAQQNQIPFIQDLDPEPGLTNDNTVYTDSCGFLLDLIMFCINLKKQ